jgi:hypothetical protein
MAKAKDEVLAVRGVTGGEEPDFPCEGPEEGGPEPDEDGPDGGEQ